MPISSRIVRQLPFLRRFARALTGSRASGDSYAAATLTALSSRLDLSDDGANWRMLLFQTFLKIWRLAILKPEARDFAMVEDLSVIDRRLVALSPLPRVAFLLRAVEGFTPAEIAELLDLPPAEVEQLFSCAGQEIAEQLRTDVVIIEDEPVTSADLETLAIDLGHRVVGVARTPREAAAIDSDYAPDMILADIHLVDGGAGLEAVNDIVKSHPAAVVLFTAYPDYPETLPIESRPEPAFFVTKPFTPGYAAAIISQALFFERRATLQRA